MADRQEMALAVPSYDFVIVISNVSNVFSLLKKEEYFFLKLVHTSEEHQGQLLHKKKMN